MTNHEQFKYDKLNLLNLPQTTENHDMTNIIMQVCNYDKHNYAGL